MTASRITLGVGYGTHDSAVCLMSDGNILMALEQERLDRVKGSRAAPVAALEIILRETSLTLGDVDSIGLPMRRAAQLTRPVYDSLDFRKGAGWARKSSIEEINTTRRVRRLGGSLAAAAKPGTRPQYFRHHDAHAASVSGVADTADMAILVMDGIGEIDTVSFYIGKRNSAPSCIRRIRYPHSLGKVYGAICRHLGFFGPSKEGQVMGLAAYGEPTFQERIAQIVMNFAGDFKVDTSYFRLSASSARHSTVSDRFVHEFGPSRHPAEAISDLHRNLAASLQAHLNETVLNLTMWLTEETGRRRVALAGGVALNCVTNGVLARNDGIDELVIPPYPHDGGLAIGAAALCAWNSGQTVHPLSTSRLGPTLTPRSAISAAESAGLAATPIEVSQLARHLARGQLIGLVNGRAEFGPRALGGRSIIADPRAHQMRLRINQAVKNRDEFRPLAPCTTVEAAPTIFGLSGPSPYMSRSVSVRSDWVPRIPAVVHTDGTARVQTVSEDDDPVLYKLLQEFGSLTGCPVLVNTSFNGRDEPLVLSAADAIASGLAMGLDGLFLAGNFVDLQWR
ncbi:carbamoyltransferase family protein [Ornithinimicrobium sediminis]|uniref:carbamoyltransferase family protein n=1 Tax=Ornithinimicrobium sediminis TaxID=2904603 RepID=UPI001E61265F|nr:carbamoyltransferase C-terminal domain-containing protein [Ornithinimicrobium sediminis]MCE0485415.1 hypothetical protein [Ornithinimicrobium sediminis]